MTAGAIPGQSAGLRRTLLITAVLLVPAGIVTFVLAADTEDRFAWTIQPPLTAAFMGGGYWATIALVVLAARSPDWAHARIAVPSTLVFASLILLATALHFDRFHEDRPITWAWVAIYLVVPALIAVFAAREARSAGRDPARSAPIPRWAVGVLAAEAAGMIALGAALLVAPGTFDGAWPWPLTPLSGRVVGAYLVGVGLGAAHSALERDWQRVRPAAATSALFGALQLVNVARYSGTFDWDDGRSWAYVAFLGVMLAFGTYAFLQGHLRGRNA